MDMDRDINTGPDPIDRRAQTRSKRRFLFGSQIRNDFFLRAEARWVDFGCGWFNLKHAVARDAYGYGGEKELLTSRNRVFSQSHSTGRWQKTKKSNNIVPFQLIMRNDRGAKTLATEMQSRLFGSFA